MASFIPYQPGWKKETLITNGNYDVMDIAPIDEKGGYVYFMLLLKMLHKNIYTEQNWMASGTLEMVSPANQKGTHDYRYFSQCKVCTA